LSSLDELPLLLLASDGICGEAATEPGWAASSSDESNSRKTSEVRPIDSSSSLTLVMIFLSCHTLFFRANLPMKDRSTHTCLYWIADARNSGVSKFGRARRSLNVLEYFMAGIHEQEEAEM
jgi:hypothetical protein